jgi:hypothetical protein
MATVDNTQTDEQSTVERIAAVEAELARLKGAETPLEAAMKVVMRDPVPSGYMREMFACQESARIARVRAVEVAVEAAALEARVHAPEIKKHERKLAEMERLASLIDEAVAKTDEIDSLEALWQLETSNAQPPTSESRNLKQLPSRLFMWRRRRMRQENRTGKAD